MCRREETWSGVNAACSVNSSTDNTRRREAPGRQRPRLPDLLLMLMNWIFPTFGPAQVSCEHLLPWRRTNETITSFSTKSGFVIAFRPEEPPSLAHKSHHSLNVQRKLHDRFPFRGSGVAPGSSPSGSVGVLKEAGNSCNSWQEPSEIVRCV